MDPETPQSAPPSRGRRPVTLPAVFIVAILLTLPHVFIAGFVVPQVRVVLHELFGERPLPWFTTVAIQACWFAVAFAFLWSLGVWLAIRRGGPRRPLTLLQLVPLCSIVFICAGLILPLVSVAGDKV
jgi:hypothetical protein